MQAFHFLPFLRFGSHLGYPQAFERVVLFAHFFCAYIFCDVTPLITKLSVISKNTRNTLNGFGSCGIFIVLAFFYCLVMTILPKKKHSESKKTDTTSNNDNRARIRGNSSWSSSAGVTERNRSSEEYSGHGEEQYLGNSFESREAADVASNTSKRRHRSPPHRHKYHERHSEETGYNSSDEYDCTQADQPLSTEEVGFVIVFMFLKENTQVLTPEFCLL